MSANRPKALALIGSTDVPLAFTWPRSLFAGPSTPGLAARARTRIRRFFASVDGRGAQTRAGTGGPGDPPEEPLRNTVWDDPALWLLMMH
jgi:hypothetical protein